MDLVWVNLCSNFKPRIELWSKADDKTTTDGIDFINKLLEHKYKYSTVKESWKPKTKLGTLLLIPWALVISDLEGDQACCVGDRAVPVQTSVPSCQEPPLAGCCCNPASSPLSIQQVFVSNRAKKKTSLILHIYAKCLISFKWVSA